MNHDHVHDDPNPILTRRRRAAPNTYQPKRRGKDGKRYVMFPETKTNICLNKPLQLVTHVIKNNNHTCTTTTGWIPNIKLSRNMISTGKQTKKIYFRDQDLNANRSYI